MRWLLILVGAALLAGALVLAAVLALLAWQVLTGVASAALVLYVLWRMFRQTDPG